MMKKVVFCLFISVLFCIPAFAHLAEIDTSEIPFEMSDWTIQSFEHQDADPWKGWAFVYVKNTSQQAWGNFHFQIYSYDNSDISNVSFVVDAPFAPVSSQTLSHFDVDNNVVGATLDLYFHDDPIAPGDIGVFQVYTDNTVDMVNFGLMIHPSPVPEPTTVALLGLGGLALLRRKL